MEWPFKRQTKEPKWKTATVGLTTEAAQFVGEILEQAGKPASYGGAVTALRLIDDAAKAEFGPTLENPAINPLSPQAIQHLIEKGALDLSAENILKTYDKQRLKS